MLFKPEDAKLTEVGKNLRDRFGLSHKAAALIDGFGVAYMGRSIAERNCPELVPQWDEFLEELPQYLSELESLVADRRTDDE